MTLPDYYQINFSLMTHHNYSLSELEEMYPYERDIYVSLLVDYLEKKQKKENI